MQWLTTELAPLLRATGYGVPDKCVDVLAGTAVGGSDATPANATNVESPPPANAVVHYREKYSRPAWKAQGGSSEPR